MLKKNVGDETTRNTHFAVFRDLRSFSFYECFTILPIADNSCAARLHVLPSNLDDDDDVF